MYEKKKNVEGETYFLYMRGREIQKKFVVVVAEQKANIMFMFIIFPHFPVCVSVRAPRKANIK